MNIQTSKLMISQFCNYINSNLTDIGFNVPVTLGCAANISGEAIWLQMLSSTPKKKYIRSQPKAVLNFALYYRNTLSGIGNVEATMLIPHEQLSEWLYQNTPILSDFTITKAEQTKTATIFERTSDGTITYQSLFEIQGQAKKQEKQLL